MITHFRKEMKQPIVGRSSFTTKAFADIANIR
jgi:hypothetical protein